MSAPVSVYYTNDLLTKFSWIRKKDDISVTNAVTKIQIYKIELQASGIICLITSIAMAIFWFLLAHTNPFVSSVFIISAEILFWTSSISTIRELFAKNSFAEKSI
ncbi:MAG: hypothetical protein KR126chlam6_00581 [Candidatus Anoxychlamydiales bacterium]|nr:hypothetical protein [Candidatus Anoxychlamydiales bacterium]